MNDAELLNLLTARVARATSGVHVLGGPCVVLDTALPAAVARVLRRFDGAELFHESLVLRTSARISKDGDRFAVGEVSGDDLLVDAQGRVWTVEKDTGELLQEGSAYVPWLVGWLDGEAEYYADDGEYAEGAFDDAGEPEPAFAVRRESRLLKRDKRAPASRWRLARALARLGKTERARNELETVVEQTPSFSWAWYDLGRLAERAGDLDAAVGDFEAAALAQPAYEHNAFFWAHAARLARAREDEPSRARYAAHVMQSAPDFARAQREAAESLGREGDVKEARELAELALAITPRDLILRDVVRRLDAAADDGSGG